MTQPAAPQPITVIHHNMSAETIALLYLQLEFAKLFEGQSPRFYSELAMSVHALPGRIGRERLQQLLAGMSEGYQLNWVHRLLTDTSFTWRLERLRIDDVTMTGMGGGVLDEVIARAKRVPSKFAELWRADSKLRNSTVEHGIDYRPRANSAPICVYAKADKLRTFDGMHRLCAAAIGGQTEMLAYVGRRYGNPKLRLNPDKAMFLVASYCESPNRTKRDLAAIIAACRVYARTYANGAEAIERALGPWVHVPSLAEALQKIRDAIR